MARKLMLALQYGSYGKGAAGLKHVEVPVRAPNKDEVLIKVEAVSLNPMDWKIQKGIARPVLPRKFPHIPATDVAGEVVEVGAEVKKFKSGDKVVAVIGPSVGGGLAQFAIAKESQTVARPLEVSAQDAAGLAVAGLTAYQAITGPAGVKLDRSKDEGPPKNILITAASGGVGHYAVQIAKLGNTHVTATCGARNIDLIKSLGADEVLDYKTPEGAALKSPSGKKYDAVIHCAMTGIPWSAFARNLSDDGIVIDLTPGPRVMCIFAFKKITCSRKKLMPMWASLNGKDLEILVEFLKEGKIKTVIDSVHPMNKAEEGWAKSIDGHATGKIIIEP